jgi:hypothetical protein
MILVSFNSNTAGDTSRTETTYPSGAYEFTPFNSVVRVAKSFAFCVESIDLYLSLYHFSFSHCVVCDS